MNILSGLEIQRVLAAVYMLVTLRLNQRDHIFLFSISNQYLPNNKSSVSFYLYVLLTQTGIRFHQFTLELSASEIY